MLVCLFIFDTIEGLESSLRFYLFIFRERGRGGKKKGEKHQYVVASFIPPTGDLASSLGMCPDWESIWWPFPSQAGTQATEPLDERFDLVNPSERPTFQVYL